MPFEFRTKELEAPGLGPGEPWWTERLGENGEWRRRPSEQLLWDMAVANRSTGTPSLSPSLSWPRSSCLSAWSSCSSTSYQETLRSQFQNLLGSYLLAISSTWSSPGLCPGTCAVSWLRPFSSAQLFSLASAKSEPSLWSLSLSPRVLSSLQPHWLLSVPCGSLPRDLSFCLSVCLAFFSGEPPYAS